MAGSVVINLRAGSPTISAPSSWSQCHPSSPSTSDSFTSKQHLRTTTTLWTGRRNQNGYWLCWEKCYFRIDSKVSGFNRRVESVILHLRSKEFQNQVNDFTEGRMRILLRLYWEKMRSVSNYRNGYHLQQSPDPANQFSVCRAEILLYTRILGGISSLFLRRRKTLDVCCLLQKIKFNKKRTMLLKRK